MQKGKTQDDEEIERGALLLVLRESIKQVGTQRAWARKHNVPEWHVSRVLKRNDDPDDALLAAIGYEQVPTRYRRVKTVSSRKTERW